MSDPFSALRDDYDKTHEMLIEANERIATLTAERDDLQSEVSRLTDVVRHADYWEAVRKEERDAAVKEREVLRDDLRACAEALNTIASYGADGICPYGCDTPHIAALALASPGVQAVLAEPKT